MGQVLQPRVPEGACPGATASIRRRWRNGRNEPRWPVCQPCRGGHAPPCCPLTMRQRSLPFAGTPCCCWTTACTRCSRPTRSSLHRCLQRHGISRLPEMDGDKPARSGSRATPSATSTPTLQRCRQPRASESPRGGSLPKTLLSRVWRAAAMCPASACPWKVARKLLIRLSHPGPQNPKVKFV